MGLRTRESKVFSHGNMDFHDNRIVVKDECFMDQGGLVRRLKELKPLELFKRMGDQEVDNLVETLHAELEDGSHEQDKQKVLGTTLAGVCAYLLDSEREVNIGKSLMLVGQKLGLDPVEAGEEYLEEGVVEPVNVFGDQREPECYVQGTDTFIVESPNVARSGFLEPCIAIGLYSSKTKRAYMIHEITMETADMTEQLRKIQELEGGSLSDVKVVAAGNSTSQYNPEYRNGHYRQSTLSNREYVEADLQKDLEARGFKGEVEYFWLDEDENAELYIDAKTGEFKIFRQRHKMRDKDVEAYDKRIQTL